jgi:hypothetical protein
MNESAANLPTAEQIAVCAYLIWEKEGRPQGREAAHWFQAEKQLLADHHHDKGILSGTAASPPARRAKTGTKRAKQFQELAI